MELSRFELANIKRTAQSVKMLRNKLGKVNEKYSRIAEEKRALEAEIENWETPILKKYGFSSEQILSGEADRMIAAAEGPHMDGTAVEEPQMYDGPAPDEWEPVGTTAASVAGESEMMY